MAGRKKEYTDEQRAALVALYNKEGSTERVAKKMGIGNFTVIRLLREVGAMKPREGGGRRDGRPLRTKSRKRVAAGETFMKAMNALTDMDCTWIAGVLESKASTTRSKNGSRGIHVSSMDESLIEHLSTLVGVKYITDPPRGRGNVISVMYRFKISSREQLIVFLPRIIPHCRTNRRRFFALILEESTASLEIKESHNQEE